MRHATIPRSGARSAVSVILAVLMIAGLLVGPATPALAEGAKVTGIVVNPNGVPLADVTVTLSGLSTTTGDDGRFTLWGVSPGTAAFARVAYQNRTVEWTTGADWMTVYMSPEIVRSVHVAGWVAASDSRFQDMLDIGATSGVNALVLDVRDTSGLVYHDSEVPAVEEMGARYELAYDLAARTAQAHGQGFYVTARISTLIDAIAASERPWWAVEDIATGEPLDLGGIMWLDPTDVSVQQYAIDLALEACAAGVDEVEFDYLRFPPVDLDTVNLDGPKDAVSRVATITDFVALVRAQLEPAGCATAVDLPGWLSAIEGDGGTGLSIETLAHTADVLTPIVFPANYAAGDYGIVDPLEDPGGIVAGAMNEFHARTAHSSTPLRPWIQDFAMEPEDVGTMIDRVDLMGDGWMLWNSSSLFSTEGIPATTDLVASEAVPGTERMVRPPSGFFDVPNGATFETEIAWMDAQGISDGCDAPWGDFYCPTDLVSRGEMAAFLARALDLTAPPGADRFTDDDGSPFEAYIEAIAAAGITVGCTDTTFCPDQPVNRAQMATFLVRAFDLPVAINPGRFTDDDGSVHEVSIATIAAAGITIGCSATVPRFCPTVTVNRGQMSAFLFRAVATG